LTPSSFGDNGSATARLLANTLHGASVIRLVAAQADSIVAVGQPMKWLEVAPLEVIGTEIAHAADY
jgi:hypothetical protein